METEGRRPEPPDLRFFDENRSRFPPEQLLPYAGQHVAWTPDGTRILASADNREALYQQLVAAGIHFNQVVFDYIDPSPSDFVLL